MAVMDRSPAHDSSGPRVPIRPISGEETSNIGRPPDKAKHPSSGRSGGLDQLWKNLKKI